MPLLLKPIKHQFTHFLLFHNTIIYNRFLFLISETYIQKRRQHDEYVHDILVNTIFTNTVSDCVHAWGLKYLLVLLVFVVNREQTIIVVMQ